ncbi:hypothetical protein [Campylobacter aviculae]|uniref:Uncharacterized protein n=1 Tax=Campylobacter aviculae TaxID=2510190 RepID=A0A4U7BII3_9BACT|nr:hypothetical protein [Campylobacter aviculae]TKX31633.1 hypothetical protein CQA76_05805 [Campylobacter aviculae]
MQVNSTTQNTFYSQINSANKKSEKEISSYKDVEDKAFQDCLDGKISEEELFKIKCASLTASLVEAYNEGIRTNLLGATKKIQQERFKSDTKEEIEIEINKDILALKNNLKGDPNLTKEQNQALNNKAQEFLAEVLQNL